MNKPFEIASTGPNKNNDSLFVTVRQTPNGLSYYTIALRSPNRENDYIVAEDISASVTIQNLVDRIALLYSKITE